MGPGWEIIQAEKPETEEILTPRSSIISPTSSTPSSSPNTRKMKPSELFDNDNSIVNTPIPQMSDLTLQTEKGTPGKRPKTPDDEDEIISEEELDNTMDTTVKQKNKNSKYELKAIDIANIEKGINIIKNKLMQEKEQEANKYDSMEVEDNTSLTENSEVWEPTPNGHEALED